MPPHPGCVTRGVRALRHETPPPSPEGRTAREGPSSRDRLPLTTKQAGQRQERHSWAKGGRAVATKPQCAGPTQTAQVRLPGGRTESRRSP